MYFERKNDFLKIFKNSYMSLLCITDPEYGGQDHKVWNFRQFLS
jgi:hypothetical protein